MSVFASQSESVDDAVKFETLSRKATQSPPRNDICCIFVHAGAGYHSHANEQIHLEACNDAAQVAMLILRNGGSALDAVEMAVKILEDREITNAGYGSNLSMDGVVECDASIVDHHGRSGAVGAVFQIKNPVSLARLVLNHTTQPLTLRRVPPNLLVSQGALQFAREMGMAELPHDALVSSAAKERWIRWHSDLKAAERRARKNGQHPSSWKLNEPMTAEDEAEQERMRREHTNNLLRAYPSLARVAHAPGHQGSSFRAPGSSPLDACSFTSSSPSGHRIATPDSISSDRLSDHTPPQPFSVSESSQSAFINSTQKVPTMSEYQEPRAGRTTPMNFISEDGITADPSCESMAARSWGDGSSEQSNSPSDTSATRLHKANIENATIPQKQQSQEGLDYEPNSPGRAPDTVQTSPNVNMSENFAKEEDQITDTVGAIAVDAWGNIACAASSGGIGMKYRGRVGPAALVGVGTAVIPKDPDDSESTCVATVTSGTGEHMATTMTATVCAERLYQSVKKEKGGLYTEVTEDEALKSMIENEFMGHPSVKNSNSTGAIGILGIKKTRQGIMLYYGHNTDSFAMASMHSDEDAPWCTMSRSSGSGQIAQGGRMMRYQRKKKTKTSGVRTPYV